MSVATMLQNAGHAIQIFDINAARYTKEEVLANLPNRKYDWIGLSGLITTYAYLKWLTPELREMYKDTPIVIGGGGITSAPEAYMENIGPDVGVIGEGEYTALELSEGRLYKDILGIAYFEDGKLIKTPPRPLEKDLDKFPMVNFDLIDIWPYAKTVKHNKGAPNELAINATRGCPMACKFCYHIFGRGVRYRSVDKFVEEMEYLITNYGITSFLIQDECFTARKSFVKEFCERVIEKGWRIGWACYSRLDTLDEETMRIMRRAGCYQIGFGIESGSQRILDAMSKKITVEKMKKTYLLATRHFPCIAGTLIYGYPGENDETLAETLAFLEEIQHVASFFFIQPYPGTPLYEEYYDKIMEQSGGEDAFFCSLTDACDPGVNLTEWTMEEYLQRHMEITKATHKILHKIADGFKKISIVYPAHRERQLAEAVVGVFGRNPTGALHMAMIKKEELTEGEIVRVRPPR